MVFLKNSDYNKYNVEIKTEVRAYSLEKFCGDINNKWYENLIIEDYYSDLDPFVTMKEEMTFLDYVDNFKIKSLEGEDNFIEIGRTIQNLLHRKHGFLFTLEEKFFDGYFVRYGLSKYPRVKITRLEIDKFYKGETSAYLYEIYYSIFINGVKLTTEQVKAIIEA